MSLILHSVEQEQVSMASALSAKMRSLGMAASMTIVTVFLSVFMGSGPIAAGGDYVHGMLFGYLSVLACLAAWFVVGRSRMLSRMKGDK